MTGRGRPRKEKNLDIDRIKSQDAPVDPEPKKGQKKPKGDGERPPARVVQRLKNTKQLKEEMEEGERDIAKASAQKARHKVCGARAKAAEERADESNEAQTKAPKETTKASARRAAAHAAKAKSPDISTEEVINEQPEAWNGTSDAKTCLDRTKSAESADETTGNRKKAPKETTKASAPKAEAFDVAATQLNPPKDAVKISAEEEKKRRAGRKESPGQLREKTLKEQEEFTQTDVDSILAATLQKLKINQSERSEAAAAVNDIIKAITDHLKLNTQCFKDVEKPLRTGSYYENVKISNPDEFDVMLPIPVERVAVEPFGDDGAFYSVQLKRGNAVLQRFRQENNTLSAFGMLQEFRTEVKKCVKKLEGVVVVRKKQGCPAVTLTKEVDAVSFALDVVLCLVVKSSWPPFTNDGLKIESWLGTKVKRDHKRSHYYLVPKYEGRGDVEHEGVSARDVWRVSFSHVEKDILMNHGSDKTCCEKDGARCCRKDCLKLLKHLLGLLKTQNKSFEKFCSYLAKTALFHACCSRSKDSDWDASGLSRCFLLLLADFERHLESGVLNNFFIPNQNLLSGLKPAACGSLARKIREQRESGFPIFQEWV